MAKKIRFPLKMKNGAEVRTLDELKENFDLESVLGYFTDGRLITWLADRYYDEKAEAVSALSADMPDLNAKLCNIFEVEYQAENDETAVELIAKLREKLSRLCTVTDNSDALNNLELVAESQDELFEILDEHPEKVYLYGDKFSIPMGATNIRYVGINTPLGQQAFSSCNSLTSIKIPSSVSCLDQMAFEGCKNLTSVTIMNSNTFLSSNVFGSIYGYERSKINDVNLPAGMDRQQIIWAFENTPWGQNNGYVHDSSSNNSNLGGE